MAENVKTMIAKNILAILAFGGCDMGKVSVLKLVTQSKNLRIW